MDANPSFENAKYKLDVFIAKGLRDYSFKRNHDLGINNKTNVSCLSPFIRRRILHEEQVLSVCLENFQYLQIEKFIQEVFWRTYWKGWLEGRKVIWKSYNENLSSLKKNAHKKPYQKQYSQAILGNTGIECFDAWVSELLETGYLHNHSRMWFASIWIFTLKLPWELGADFFYKNLLDADPASNTLSWRWVAGLQTKGKIYLANEENIEKFSKFKFKSKNILEKNPKTLQFEFCEYKNFFYINDEITNSKAFLIDHNHLIYNVEYINKLRDVDVFILNEKNYYEDSEKKDRFNQNAINEYIKFLKDNDLKINILNNFEELSLACSKKKTLITNYPGVGYELDKINEASKKYEIEFKFIYDQFDLMCWPYAKAGFFKFKKQIPSFLENIHN